MGRRGVIARAMPQGDILGYAPPLCLHTGGGGQGRHCHRRKHCRRCWAERRVPRSSSRPSWRRAGAALSGRFVPLRCPGLARDGHRGQRAPPGCLHCTTPPSAASPVARPVPGHGGLQRVIGENRGVAPRDRGGRGSMPTTLRQVSTSAVGAFVSSRPCPPPRSGRHLPAPARRGARKAEESAACAALIRASAGANQPPDIVHPPRQRAGEGQPRRSATSRPRREEMRKRARRALGTQGGVAGPAPRPGRTRRRSCAEAVPSRAGGRAGVGRAGPGSGSGFVRHGPQTAPESVNAALTPYPLQRLAHGGKRPPRSRHGPRPARHAATPRPRGRETPRRCRGARFSGICGSCSCTVIVTGNPVRSVS